MYALALKRDNDHNSSGYRFLFQRQEQSYKRHHFIINPVSAAGRTGRKSESILSEIHSYFGSEFSFSFTEAPRHATLITRQAIMNGAELIVAIGGDGTIQEVINGFLQNGEPINPDCRLGIISSGTGQGLAQGLRLPKNINRQLEIIKTGNDIALDLGCITYFDNGEFSLSVRSGRQRIFVNEFQVGIGVDVVKAVQLNRKRYGGFLAFGVTALIKGLSIRPQTIRMQMDNGEEISIPAIGVVVANGPYTGGGMNLTPRALLNDGLLDVLIIHTQSFLQRLTNFSKIYTGRHISGDGFTICRVKRIFLSAEQPLETEADGELLNCLPCQIDVLLAAIRVKTGEAL